MIAVLLVLIGGAVWYLLKKRSGAGGKGFVIVQSELENTIDMQPSITSLEGDPEMPGHRQEKKLR